MHASQDENQNIKEHSYDVTFFPQPPQTHFGKLNAITIFIVFLGVGPFDGGIQSDF
jgi:hypothetical protein